MGAQKTQQAFNFVKILLKKFSLILFNKQDRDDFIMIF